MDALDLHSWLEEAGFDVALAPNAKLSFAYDGQLGAHARDNGLKSDLTWKF